MILSIASGKGGTGKTTVAVNLAFALNKVRLLDCDVEEPNSHIFVKPEINSIEPVHIKIPQIDKTKCDFCGKCAEVCAYKAIAVLKTDVLVFKEICHGCGACEYFCPQKAIKEINKDMGKVYIGKKDHIDFISGKLNIGEAAPSPVIKAVKTHLTRGETNIIDAPPGTSCSMIESVNESDFCVMVTEPTPFGLNDLKLSVDVLKKTGIPFGIIINRSDLGNIEETRKYCEKNSAPVLMEIPFSRKIAEIYSRGEILVKSRPEYKDKFKNLFETIKKSAAKKS